MFQTLIDALKFKISNDDQDTRRAHERHTGGKCVGIIDGVSYPVENWSKGGALLMGDDRQFGVNDIKDVTLRFKLSDRVIDILQTGHVLRKGRDKFVMQFAPLTQNIDRQFNSIVDDYMAQEFMRSQS